MQPQRLNEIHRINYLTSEMDSIYHQASLRLGISDSVSIILYTIQDKGESCLLSDVYKSSGVSRQTVNSAIRRLEADGVLYLEPYAGRAKKSCRPIRGGIISAKRSRGCLKRKFAPSTVGAKTKSRRISA